MSARAPALSVLPLVSGQRTRLVRRAKALSWVTVGWMTVEAGVSIVAAVTAGSVALLGFGLDSLIELASAGVVLWRFTGSRTGSQASERRAQQLIAGCFAALALYLAYAGILDLVDGNRPSTSWIGVAVAVGAIIVMPMLGRAKRTVGSRLGSSAVASDAAQSWLCAATAAAVLVSLVANAALGWWWLDPTAALLIAGAAAHESREAWRGEACGDCAPSSSATRDRPAAATATASRRLTVRRRR